MVAAVPGLAPGFVGSAFAQAWLAPKGEASFSLGYVNMWVKDHVFNDGVPFDAGRINSQVGGASLGYSVSDRFALGVVLPPYVAARYRGDYPHDRNGVVTLDDGSYHGTFQDFRIEARFMATTGSLAVTPLLGVIVPSHHYEHFAHAAPGKDLKEVQLGVNLGRRLDPLLPDAYLQARYAFSVPERVLGIAHDRSNLNLELGYLVTPALTVHVLGFIQVSHGGFREPDDIVTLIDYEHHDQLARTNFFEAGFGASYTRSIDAYATWSRTVSARNTHVMAGIVAVGFSANFSPAQMLRNRKPRPSAS